jgi:hypothetical protein
MLPPKNSSEETMVKIDWSEIKNFKKSEFPCDPDKYASPTLIYNLQALREHIGLPIYPSPVDGALARIDEESRTSAHYSNPAEGLLSIAIDIFIQGNPFENFYHIINSCLYHRVGIYFDTYYSNKEWTMFHVDMRVEKQVNSVWYRDQGEYFYPIVDGFKNLIRKFNEYRTSYFLV